MADEKKDTYVLKKDIYIPSYSGLDKETLGEKIAAAVDAVLSDTINPEKKASYTYSDGPASSSMDKTYIVDNAYDLSTPALNPEDFNMSAEELASSMFSIAQLEKSELGYDEFQDFIKEAENISSMDQFTALLNKVDEAVRNMVVGFAQNLLGTVTGFLSENIPQLDSIFGIIGLIGGIAGVINDSLMNYQNGVTETNFGQSMELSWKGIGMAAGSDNGSFLNYFNTKYSGVAEANRKINFLTSTPLDGGEAREALFGTLMMGCPYLFNQYSDPGNRALINSFIKDGRFITFTPGLPKYNGLTSYMSAKDSILNQTDTPEKMLNYLLKNGLDKSFMEKDKRYYTFKTEYGEYFSYLETMLNTVWVKLGLAKNGEQFNLFTFFNIKQQGEGGIDPTGAETLRARYNSSIGFFCNAASSLSESISNSNTGYGQELAGRANSNSDDYQRINYMTGMGGGSPLKNAARTASIIGNSGRQISQLFKDTFDGTAHAWGRKDFSSILSTVFSVADIAGNIVFDTLKFEGEQDKAAILQSFATTNGMKVVFPELWADSAYSKNVNFNFSFVSPYGDPLSIFKYVYVPFFSLLCFAMPRQAAENGYVSPFFVRADVPGLFTSDLALISDISWTKGGGSALWTKDGLPRAIDVSITLSDLYPYLSMTKRLSYLSANPSYAVFLDSFSGQLALNDGSTDDVVNEYFRAMIDRVSGNNVDGAMWNKFNSTKSRAVKDFSSSSKGSSTGAISRYSIPWIHNSSI